MKKIKKTIIALILGLFLSFTIIISNGIKAKADTITDLTGYTWTSYNSVGWWSSTTNNTNTFYLNFTGDNINFTSIQFWNFDDDGEWQLGIRYIGNSTIGIFSNYASRYEPKNSYMLINESFPNLQTITITGGTDATNSTLIAWLQANGTLTAPAPATYTITFNANGGTGTPPASVQVNSGDHYTIPGNTTGLTREGYNFIGWNTSSTATTGATSLSNIISNITLYAIWQIQQFTITFNANGGTGTPPSQTLVNYGANYTIPGNTTGLTRANYHFVGWNTFSDATWGLTTLSNITSNRTLYAIWAPDTYTITFNANGGTGTPPSQLTLEYGTTYRIPGNTTNLTRDGYTFQGWNTSSTAQTGLNQIIIETNTTLYAIWRIDRSDLLKIYLNDNLVGQYSIITTGTSAHYMIAFDGFDIALFELYLNGGELSPQYQSTSYILSSNMNNIVFTLSGENIYTLLIYNNDTLEEDWTYDDLVENGTAYIHFYNGGDIDIKIYTRQGINTDTESLINTFKMLFKGANEILNIRFGWITIGGILAIVLSIGVIFFIFKLIRGGL